MKLFRAMISSFLIVSMLATHTLALAEMPKWSYDPGPDPQSALGKQLIDINASIPHMPEISEQVMGDQKFRPAFGPIPWRMRSTPNSVKILFIGQDGTHIAEAAGRPATAGFGGRAQDLAAYFGVGESAAFINAYAYTIKGQYGAFESPQVVYENGKIKEARYSSFIDNKLWLISNDQASPIPQWRNDLIDWIIRNNRDSLQMIVSFGNAANDAIGTFIEARGGKVGTRFDDGLNTNIQIPETMLLPAGGNNEFPVPVTVAGRDLYSEIVGQKLRYSDGGEDANGKEVESANQKLAMDTFKQQVSLLGDKLVFSRGGPARNGVIHPAQLGSFDLRKIQVNGVNSLSLKGLKLSDGTTIKNNVLVAKFPHPSSLSSMQKEVASAKIAEALEGFDPYVKAGWSIQADPGRVNQFAAGQPYVYGRSDIGPEYYDFGTPESRMVSHSSASRKDANTIIFGTRDQVRFDEKALRAATKAKPAKLPSSDEVFTARPRGLQSRYVFDAGPAERYARAMKESLNFKELYALKPEYKTVPLKYAKDDLEKKRPLTAFEQFGIDVYYVKSHPKVGDFGHYRGTFKNPQVVILADPDGYDDLITSRALTGTRGQYLHGLLEQMGVNDQYLVIKTVPVGMDGASYADWDKVRNATRAYREAIFKELLADNTPKLFIADGTQAFGELDSLVTKYGNAAAKAAPRVRLGRTSGNARDTGLSQLMAQINATKLFGEIKQVRMADIPRSHLSYYARLWEGTSGDRVFAATDLNRGESFAEVAPEWAYYQNVKLGAKEQAGVNALLKKLEQAGMPMPRESIQKFIQRVGKK